MKKILYFTPYFAIWDYVRLDMNVIRALRSEDMEVTYLGCNGFLSDMCPAMSASGLTEVSPKEKKQAICTFCRSNRNVFSEKFGEVRLLDKYLTNEDFNAAESLGQAISQETILGFSLNGIPLGSLCLYEISISLKKQELIFTDVEFDLVRIHLKNVILTYKAYERFLESHSFDAVVMYNTQYSNNGVIAHLSEKSGMRVYFTHNGLNISDRDRTLMMGQRSTGDFLKKSVKKWKETPMAEASSENYSYTTDHLMSLMKGKSVFAYSAKAGAKFSSKEVLKIPSDKKIVVAAMSSGDERMAAQVTGWIPSYETLFKTQVDWAQFLLDWIKTRPDLYLIFRIHPREFPNKREQILSEQAKILKDLFLSVPENAIVNWPDDNVSLYDLAEYTDVFLNAWSSVGKEMALLGLPVAIFSKDLIWYPEDLNYLGETKEKYIQAIDRALSKGWSSEHSIRAFRWMNYEMNLSHIRLGTGLVRSFFKNKIVRKIVKKMSPILWLKFDIFAAVPLGQGAEKIVRLIREEKSVPFDLIRLKEVPINSKDKKYLKEQYRKILKALYPPGKSTRVNGLYDKIKYFIDAE